MDTNNVHLSFWHKDEQEEAADLRAGWRRGRLNANHMAGEKAMWFLRGGLSDGYVAERNLSAGFGWRPSALYFDLLGFGWARLANDALREQYTAETFYRFHLTPNLAIRPDLQSVVDPTVNPAIVPMGFRASGAHHLLNLLGSRPQAAPISDLVLSRPTSRVGKTVVSPGCRSCPAS